MSTCRIIDWLERIPIDPTTTTAGSIAAAGRHLNPHHRSRKRRKHNPPTPESFRNDMDAGREDSHRYGKRRDRDDQNHLISQPNSDGHAPGYEMETTPRPSRKRVQTPRSESSYSLPSLSRSGQSQPGRASPQKHLNALERSEGGIRVRELSGLWLSEPAPAPEMATFLAAMRRVSRGREILSRADRPVLEAAAFLHRDFAEMAADDTCFFDAAPDDDEDADNAALAPPPKFVLDILAAATECQENLHAEPTWNMMVHHEILRLALRPPDRPMFGTLINFMPCSTATILPDYLPVLSPSKKVDFCIYVEPAVCPDPNRLQSAVRTARDRLPGGVINHTAYFPLRERPIALGIETKKTGEGWEGATLQLAVWLAAHWNLLHQLTEAPDDEELGKESGPRESGAQSQGAGGEVRAQRHYIRHGVGGQDNGDLHDGHDDNSHGKTGQNIPTQGLPDFLPGIIIQDHDWYLVLSTRQGRQTILWSSLTIGSTSSVMGIYQILRGLRLIRRWIADEFWPRLQDSLLGE